MMALGTAAGRLAGLFGTGVRIASNPRKDKHRIAAPGQDRLAPATLPSPPNGAQQVRASVTGDREYRHADEDPDEHAAA